MVQQMETLGFDTEAVAQRPAKRARSRLVDRIKDNPEAQKDIERKKSHSRKPQKDTSSLSEPLRKRARVATHLSQRNMKFTGQKGEADRYTTASLQKYLNSGKRKNGTHYAR